MTPPSTEQLAVGLISAPPSQDIRGSWMRCDTHHKTTLLVQLMMGRSWRTDVALTADVGSALGDRQSSKYQLGTSRLRFFPSSHFHFCLFLPSLLVECVTAGLFHLSRHFHLGAWILSIASLPFRSHFLSSRLFSWCFSVDTFSIIDTPRRRSMRINRS